MYLHLIAILYEAALNCLNRPYSGRVGLLKQSPPAWAKFGASLLRNGISVPSTVLNTHKSYNFLLIPLF